MGAMNEMPAVAALAALIEQSAAAHAVAGRPLTEREKILAFERDICKAGTTEQTPAMQLRTEHRICNGVYYRTVYIPRGTLLTGRIHRRANMSVCLQGDISEYTETGGLQRFVAGDVVESPAGHKRIGFAVEDTVWMTADAVGEETDIAKIEAMLYADSYEDLEPAVAVVENEANP